MIRARRQCEKRNATWRRSEPPRCGRMERVACSGLPPMGSRQKEETAHNGKNGRRRGPHNVQYSITNNIILCAGLERGPTAGSQPSALSAATRALAHAAELA